MCINNINMYQVEEHIAEIYDQQIYETYDVNFIVDRLRKYKCTHILEPFCGTGRIAIPVAEAGCKVTGMDSSASMLDRLHSKTDLPIKTKCTDVISYYWGSGYDAVIIGCNSFFELATLDEQKIVFDKAVHSVRNGGFIYIDSASIEKELPDSWCVLNNETTAFPTGTCSDGTELKGYWKTIYADKENKIWRSKRRVETYKDSKLINETSYVQQKHPIGCSEIMSMIENSPVEILESWNSTENPAPLKTGDDRAVFWLRKT